MAHVISKVVGATTDTSARVVAKMSGAETGGVLLRTAENPSLTSSTDFGPETPDAQGMVYFHATGLAAGTRHWYGLIQGGTLENSAEYGQFITDPVAPGQPASYIMGAAGDAGLSPLFPGLGPVAAPNRLSNHPIFDLIRQRAVAENWLRLVHLGDMTYYDLGSGNHGLSAAATAAQYRGMWDDLLAQPRQHQLYREVPWTYVWDDHDFGPNNSDKFAPGRDNACTVFRERAPEEPLPAGVGANPIYRDFDIGRVKHVVFDTRADRDPGAATPTMLGSAQKTWLDTLLAGTSAEALVAWMPTPWPSLVSTDSWGAFPDERLEVRDIFGDNGFLNRMIMMSADTHAVAVATGGHNPFGGFPLLLCASLDATPSTLSGPSYDVLFTGGRNQYATLQVHDSGDDVALTGTVYRGSTPLAWTSINTGGTTAVGAGNPSHVLAL